MFTRGFFILIFVSLLTSCISEPDYSIVPEISFEGITAKPTSLGRADSVTLVIRFQDGDGDLGLSPSAAEDRQPPFQDFNPDSTLNKFRNNIFVGIERLEGERFVAVALPEDASFDGRFPLLNTLERETPLEGTLSYDLLIFYDFLGTPLSAGDEVRFIIQIADRALNESNQISTSSIILGQP